MLHCCRRLAKLKCDRRSVAGSWRPQSYSTLSSRPSEQITIAAGSNGSIVLDVFHPTGRALTEGAQPAVLIYLPRGPFLSNEEEEASTLATLQSNTTCHLVRINYRLSREWQFPTPVHDMLAGYDWIQENLLTKRAIARAGRAENVGKLAVCGELIGGGLATALALTECRASTPGIVAAALNNPIVDWVSLGGTLDVKKGNSKAAMQWDSSHSTLNALDALPSLRDELFRKPEHYFDPFASPVLFFRTAGAGIPSAPELTPMDDMERLSMIEREEFERQQLPIAGDDRRSLNAGKITTSEAPIKHRKRSRRYPSKGLGLRLPNFQITAGSSKLLKAQAQELQHLLRQSFVRQSEEKSTEFGRKVLPEEEQSEIDDDERHLREVQQAEADRKAKLYTTQGLGLWDCSRAGQARVAEMAAWMKTQLG